MKKLEKREWVGVIVALAAVAIIFFGSNIWQFLFGAGVRNSAEAPLATVSTTTPSTLKNVSNIPGLEIYDIQVGTGTEAVAGKNVVTHYVGVLSNGKKFDSSIDRNMPFEFPLGGGRVIKGWDLGILGMKVGGIRRLVVSPELGYGAQPIGPIPANSTLIFEVQLLEVK